jgi:hypothetical protein
LGKWHDGAGGRIGGMTGMGPPFGCFEYNCFQI